MRYSLFVVLILTIATISFGVTLDEVLKWKYVDFIWTKEQRQKAIDSGNYNASNCILYDVDKAPGRVILFKSLAN